jgi:Concanavalin A-like lectin/glucanases superfamily
MNLLAWLTVLTLAAQAPPASELQVLDSLTFDHLLRAPKTEAQVGWEPPESYYPLRIEGGVVAVPGISGAALRFDGVTGHCELRRAHGSAEFTVEAWVALAAYPPAWCTLASQWHNDQGWRIDIGSDGQLHFEVASEKGLVPCASRRPLRPLRTGHWTHIVAVCDAKFVLRLYVDGHECGANRAIPPPRLVPDEPLRIGAPSPYWFARDLDQPPTTDTPLGDPGFGLDGTVDEVRTYRGAMPPDEVRRRFESVAAGDPPFPVRHLPDGPAGPGAFGAVACSLAYYPDWDALRDEGPAPDVVVRFDTTEARFVFWGGLSHEPLWVAQDGLRAMLSSGLTLEYAGGPFLTRPDEVRSFVRILSSHPARSVVHCRRLDGSDPLSEPEEQGWLDDIWTIYPDACGVRRTSSPARGKSASMPTELKCVWEPDQDPCDLLNADFLALASLEGAATIGHFGEEHQSRAWAADHGGFAIELLNLKSAAKPFLAMQSASCEIVEPQASALDEAPQGVGDRVRAGTQSHWVYGGGVGPFLVPGGAEFAQARGDSTSCEMLFGMRAEGMDKLQPLARSWARPPELVLASPKWSSLGWDRSQRAWRIERVAWSAELAFRIEANEASPMVRPAIVVLGWGERAVEVTIDGEPAREGVDFRQGLERQLGPTDLVLWIDREATSPVSFRIAPRS